MDYLTSCRKVRSETQQGTNFNEEQIELIESLANTCPYTGGNAVYRARNLMALLKSGIHYDDLVICNSQGVYKNGNSPLLDQLTLLDNSLKQHMLNEAGIIVYPNPANDKIEIEYSLNIDEQADLDIYDMLGSKVKTVKLYSGITKVTIEIGELANGLYLYSVRTNSGNQYFGKLIKE
jgi:hypothetical protein